MSAPRTVLRDVRVFDGTGLTEPRNVVIDGALIGTDPDGASGIDGRGATVLPGLIDAHLHLRGPEDLDALARWGVTTGLDMACFPREQVARLRASTAGRADMRSAGLPAIGPDGPHSRMPGMPREAIVLTDQAARDHVAAQVADGVDYIKAVAEPPGAGGPSPEVLAAVVTAAREHGLLSIIHAATVDSYAMAVEAGADVVTHAPLRGVIREEDIAAMVAQDRWAVPTAIMMATALTSGRHAGRGSIEDVLASVAALHEAGVPVLAGTDANAVPGAPATIPHGRSLHDELELLVRAGMSTVEVLRAATSGPAELFSLTDRGAVRPGLRADLVLVDGDPVADIRATRAIRAVWCAGIPVAPVGDAD